LQNAAIPMVRLLLENCGIGQARALQNFETLLVVVPLLRHLHPVPFETRLRDHAWQE